MTVLRGWLSDAGGCGYFARAVKWRLPTLAALVVVMVLAAVSTLAGLAIGGPAGAVIGAVTGALAGVAAGYVPVFQDRARHRREKLEQDAASQAEAHRQLSA